MLASTKVMMALLVGARAFRGPSFSTVRNLTVPPRISSALDVGVVRDGDHVEIPIEDMRDMICTLLTKQGHEKPDAKIIADTLVYAELRGNNQGVIKLIAGALKPFDGGPIGKITSVYETPVSTKLDGGQRNGMVVLKSAVTRAIAHANKNHVGIVGCSNYSSASGALGLWARDIAKAGHIGIVMSQCQEYVAPHGSYEPIFGTNPMAIGVPTQPRPQVLDMATSAAAFYGLVTAAEEGKSIPNDVAYDSEGRSTTDPAEAIKGALRVFDRSHKGSHLALMVELLAGAFTGASMKDKLASQNWGSLVIAINPSVFGPDAAENFIASANDMCERVKNAKRIPGENGPLYLPGERGDALEAVNLQKGTLRLSKIVFDEFIRLIDDETVQP